MDIKNYWKSSAQAQRQMKEATVLHQRAMYSWRVNGRINIQFTDGNSISATAYDVAEEVMAANAGDAVEIVEKRHASAYNKQGVTVVTVSWINDGGFSAQPSAIMAGIA